MKDELLELAKTVDRLICDLAVLSSRVVQLDEDGVMRRLDAAAKAAAECRETVAASRRRNVLSWVALLMAAASCGLSLWRLL